MFKSILVTCPDQYKAEVGDWVVYIGQTEKDVYPEANYNLWYEFVDVTDTPKDIQDGGYVPIEWGKHVTPLRKALKSADTVKTNVRLVFMSNDHESNAMALALATSECNMFKGKFTPELFEKYFIHSIDVYTFTEFLGVRSRLVDEAKLFLPTKAKTCTRYELLGYLTVREAIHLTLDKVMGRKYNLIDYDIGIHDVPQKKVGWR